MQTDADSQTVINSLRWSARDGANAIGGGGVEG